MFRFKTVGDAWLSIRVMGIGIEESSHMSYGQAINQHGYIYIYINIYIYADIYIYAYCADKPKRRET